MCRKYCCYCKDSHHKKKDDYDYKNPCDYSYGYEKSPDYGYEEDYYDEKYYACSSGKLKKCPSKYSYKKKEKCEKPPKCRKVCKPKKPYCKPEKKEKPCLSCKPKKPCDCEFTDLLTRSLDLAREVERNINTLYENDPVGVTQPLDRQLLRLTERVLITLSINIKEMKELFNPCDFICDGDFIYRRLLDASLEVPVIEGLLVHINALKSSTDPAELCLAEQDFIVALTSADYLLGEFIFIQTTYKCIDNCCL